MTVIPPRIARGQTLGICAPAGPANPARLAKGLAILGDAFALRLTDSVTAPRAPDVPPYLAASDDVRAAELSSLLADPDVRAIVLARGGYGLARILARLDPGLIARDPKPIVAFSDGTALLAWAYAAGVRGIHGPMVGQLGELAPAEAAALVTMLTEARAPGERPWPLVAHGAGLVRGHLVPANLTLASMLVGTPWPLPLAGAIALFEDTGEVPYKLDRYLTQLAQTGALGGVRALIAGDFIDCKDDALALATVVERAHAAGVPAASGAPIGHGNRNEPVPFGATCEIDLAFPRFTILDAAVA
ncbi:MAG TPA: LD-carboxypeptidase [Kofleriaceae bacterium]|jgi:muramoyltetrapeptide carboxypeptidase